MKKWIIILVIIVVIPIGLKLVSIYEQHELQTKKDNIVKSTEKYLQDHQQINEKLKLGHCYITTKNLYDEDYVTYEESHDNKGAIINLYIHYDLNDNTLTYLESTIDGLTECSK